LIPAKAISLATENDRTWARYDIVLHPRQDVEAFPANRYLFLENNICSWRIYPHPRTPALASRIGRRCAALESANCDRCRSRATYRERRPPIARGSIYSFIRFVPAALLRRRPSIQAGGRLWLDGGWKMLRFWRTQRSTTSSNALSVSVPIRELMR
jgi:hypothetical protein